MGDIDMYTKISSLDQLIDVLSQQEAKNRDEMISDPSMS